MEAHLHHCLKIIPVLLVLNFMVGAFNLCDNAPKSCQCLSVDPERMIQLQCLGNGSIEAKIKYSEGSTLFIECFNSEFDLNILDMEIGRLEYLTLQNCKANFRQFDEFFGKLRENTRLRKLVVEEALMENVDVDVLYEYINGTPVEIIHLNDNNLEELPEILSNLPKLLELNLNNNLIKEIPKKVNFPKLRALFLANNGLKHLDSGSFENATELRFIDLSNNNITIFPVNLLHPLPNLKVFILNSNKFEVIPSGFFERNPLLLEVIFNNTCLIEISDDTFSKSTQLKKLRLNNNMLRTLPQNIFANLTRLENLIIDNNLFEELSENIFKDLRTLTYLFLSNNKLTKWSYSNNKYLISLKGLNLNNNKLSKIEARTFSGLLRLKTLELRHNEISEIEPTALNDLQKLNTLDLSFNKLTEIDGVIAMLIGATNLKKFYFTNNSISHIKVPEIKARSRSLPIRLRHTLSISRNPFDCDCKNYEFIRFVQTSVEAGKLKISGNEACANPPQLKGIKLKNVNLRNFTCFDGCPSGCVCQIDPETKFYWMDCSNGNWTKIPPIPHAILWDSQVKIKIIPEKVQVNLENNRIQVFTKDFSYENVTILNLSRNKLTGIDWIPPRIEVLNLDHNMISNLDSNVIYLLNDSETLGQLTLNNNPWYCDCKMMEFVTVMRSNLVKIMPNNTITCSDGFPLLEIYNEKVCDTIPTLLVIVIVISSLAVLIAVVLLILYFRYENYVKIWLYNHKLLPCLKENDIDRDKIYDAFVSYSHKDEEFVEKCLAPELENGPEKYKLCLHERDWVIGEYIPKQIFDSVRNSRRTIIVLSQNFLTSDWGNMEFKTAHGMSMDEERTRIIIILYGNVDINDIKCNELLAYLTTNTYIKWDDPWFWKKLRRSMPSNRKKHKRMELNKTDNAVVDT